MWILKSERNWKSVFGFVYPYEYRKDIPVKVSVSDLKKKSYHEDTDIEEAVYFEPDIVPLVPRFIEEKEGSGKRRSQVLQEVLPTIL